MISGFSDTTAAKPAKELPRITGSEAVIRSFLNENVETIFGYPGGAIIPVYNALYDYRDKLNHILSLNIDKGWRRKAAGFESVEHKFLTFGICRMYICKKPYIKVAS